MKSIETSSDLEKFLALKKALLLLSPEWSSYPKRVEDLLRRNEIELMKGNISLGICRVDLCPVTEWLGKNTKHAGWAAGSGTIIAFKSGGIVGSADTPWSWTENQTLDWISSVLPE